MITGELGLCPYSNVIYGLELVHLLGTQLTTEQLTGIYRMVADRRCPRMIEIDLGENDLSSVPQDLQDNAKLNQSVIIANLSSWIF